MTQRPRLDMSDPVERTLCVFSVVILCRHPPDCHTLVALSSRLQSMAELLAYQCTLILFPQESSGFTRGKFWLTSDNPIMPKL